MGRLGQQGDGVGDVAAHRLDECESTEDQQCEEQPPLARFLAMLVVPMLMSAVPMMLMVVPMTLMAMTFVL